MNRHDKRVIKKQDRVIYIRNAQSGDLIEGEVVEWQNVHEASGHVRYYSIDVVHGHSDDRVLAGVRMVIHQDSILYWYPCACRNNGLQVLSRVRP